MKQKSDKLFQWLNFVIFLGFLLVSGCAHEPVPLAVVSKGIQLPGATPLMEAAVIGNKESVKEALKNKTDINSKNYTDNLMTALHYASRNKSDQVEIVQMLLSAGANPNSCDTNFRTPLHYAASQSNSKVVKALLQHGGDLTIEDSFNNTPFFYAIQNRHTECAEILFDAGSKIVPYTTTAEKSQLTAESYLIAAEVYKKHGLKEKSREAFLNASNNFTKAADQYDTIITTENWKTAGKFVFIATLDIASVVLAHQQAQMNANQMAQIDAMKSPTGKGTGFGSAPLNLANPTAGGISGLKDLCVQMAKYCREESKKCKTSADSL